MRFLELMSNLQAAIGPVILISGVGLLLLSMTNRFSRLLDRSREMIERCRTGEVLEMPRLRSELEILYGRARILRTAVTFGTLSVLAAALLVIVLFVAALRHIELGSIAAILFIACLGFLIISLSFFLLDINRSLHALKLELKSLGGADHK